MKKILTVVVALLLLISMVGCGTFSYNINNYVKIADYTDGKIVFIDKTKVEEAVKDAVDELVEAYPEIKDKTTGEVKDGDTVYIYYEGTLILFEGETTLKVGESGVKGFDEALKKAEFNKKGELEFELKLADDFTIPAFAKKAEKEEDKKEESKEEAKDEKAAEAAETAEPSKEETKKEEVSYFAGKTTKIKITVEGKTGKVADGEELKCTLRWTEPKFKGGVYNADTEKEAAEKEEAAKKSESHSHSEEEEEKRPGFELEIGSNSFIEGFEKGLIGLPIETNKQITLDLTFPNPYTSNKQLSGMDVEFLVTLLSATEKIERDPETQWDDIKASILEENENAVFDYANVDEYKAEVELAKKMELATTKILYASEMKKWPVSDYNDYKQNYDNYMYNQLYMQWFYGGGYNSTSAPTKETLVTRYGGFKSMTEYKQHVADNAGLQLKRDLILYQIAKDQGLTDISDEDLIAYAYDAGYTEKVDGKNVGDKDALIEAYGKDEAKKAVAIYKAQEYLAGIAPMVTVEK
ncbi:MAG: hypothetical protein J6M12_08875 [Clostridia bacterium]|nr:hypothetical protein [Clostridia bacterium]